MRKHRSKIRALKRAIMSFTLFCLSMLMVLTSMTTGVSANDDEVYFNDDMSVVIKVDRTLDKNELKLDLSVNTDKNITIEDIQVKGESIKNDEFLYSYAVGDNGNYKFSVITTRIEEIINDNEETEKLERQETFIFTVKVDEIVEVQEEKETQVQIEEKTETDLEIEILDPNELVEDVKDTNVDALPEDNQDTGTEVVEEKEVIPDGTVVRQLDKLPSMSEIDSVLADDEYILYDQETGRIDVIKDSQRTQNVTRQKRASTSTVTKGKILSQGVSFYWKANPSFAWNLPGGMSEFFVNAIDAYCIEPGVLDVETYNAVATDLASVGEIRVMDGRLYTTLTPDQQDRMELIANYGYRYEGHQTDAYRWATQVLIFETVGWGFNSYGTLNITSEIAEIERLISSHTTRPSWHGEEKEVKIGAIVDLSNSLNGSFLISSHEGLEIIEDSGTTLKVKVIDKNATLVMSKKQGSKTGTSYIYTDGHSQRVGNFGLYDPVRTFLDFKVVSHSQRFLKLGEDGEPLAGVKFRASYNNTLDTNGLLIDGWDYVTGADGYTPYDTWNNDGAVVYVQEIQAIAPYVNNKEIKTFTVTAGSETTLSFTNAKAVGTASIAKTEKGTTTPIAGVVYDYVHSSGRVVDTVTTNAYGIATTGKHPLGSYSFVEKSVPAPYILDATPIPANLVYKDQHTAVVSVSVKQENSKAVGNASVTKTEKGTTTPIAGVVYDYVHSSGRVVETLTTNAQGIAKTKNHDLGNYSFVEKFVPAPYILDATPIPANLVYKDQHTAVVSASVKQENSRAVGRIEVIKVSNHGDPLQGVKLNVLNASNTIVASLVTGVDGKFSTGELPLGTYTIIETATINGFVLDKTPHTVTLEYKDQVTPIVLVSKEISNKHQRSDLTFTKVENDWDKIFPQFNGITLSGAVIELYAKTDIYEGSKRIYRADELVGTEVTNSAGQVTYHNLPIGDYYGKEKTSPIGYVLFQGQWDASIKYDGKNVTTEVTQTGVTVTNQVIYGQATLIKTNGGRELLSGAVFGVFTKDGTKITELTTNNWGMIVTPELRYGDYYFEELKAPIGHWLDDTKIPFTISEHESMQYLTAPNKLIEAKLLVHKIDSETLEPLAGVGFKILDSNNEVVTIKFQDGKNVIEKSEWITDEDGEFLLEAYLPYGKYTLIESITPEGYNPIEPIKFVIDENQDYINLEVIGSVLDLGNIGNTKIYGDLLIKKISAETGLPLAGTVFDIYNAQMELVDTITTDENGEALLTHLVYGQYHAFEVSVPFPHVINPDKAMQSFFVSEEGKVYELVYENMTTSISIYKIDKETGLPIPNTIFDIYNVDKEFLETVTTDENGLARVEGYDFGTYYVEEMKVPLPYVINPDNKLQELVLSETNNHYEITFENVQAKGRLEGLKLDYKDATAVEGAKYGLFTLEDELVQSTFTDKDGKFVFKGFALGKYYVQEIETVDGYRLDETKYYVDFEYANEYTPVILQTLTIEEMRMPEIGTTASFVERDKQEPNIVTLVDKVRYLNLVIGKEYTVNGLLMNPDTGLPIIIDGKEITATTTFIADKHDGFVEVFFTFDASKLETKKVVVFEDLLEEETPIAFHHDLTDIHQTVEIPEIGTSLSFTERDKQEPNIVTLTDVVSYNGLVIGKEYTVTGVLMDFYTEKPILIDGKEITASTSFIAESTSGTVNVEFVFDQNKLTTDRVVAFEKVEEGERLIAVHADINDLEQTIDILTYRILKKDSGTKEVLKDAEFTRWDIDGNVIEVKSTDENGVVEFKLFYGEINTTKETDAPLGYLLSEEVVTMDTTEHEDGTLFEIEYLNTPKPAVMLPPTGVNNTSFLFALPIILLGMVLLIAAIIKKRQARSEMTGFSTVSLNKGSKFYEQFVNDESHEGNTYVHGTTTPGTNKRINQNSQSHSRDNDDSHGNKLE